MKHNIFNIITTSALALAFFSCDPVDENERFGEVTDINGETKVLVEEFTGQFCPNCPYGHDVLKNIKEMYGENAVIVGIHAGDMAFADETYGLKTQEGDAYAKPWNVQNYPSAIVNRRSALMDDRSQWQGAVFKEALKAPSAKIQIEASLSEDGKSIDIKSHLTSRNGERKVNYQLWITEDNIIALQQKGEDYIADYEHSHVYRATVNSVGGESVSISEGKDTELSHSVSLNSKWNAKNLHVVGFIYDNSGVLQAEEAHVE